MSRGLHKGLVAATAIACIGGATLATAGQAVAYGVTDVATLTSTSDAALAAGTQAQPLGSVSLSFGSSMSAAWSAGDEMTFQLWDTTANQPLSQSAINPFDSAVFHSVPSVSATSPIDSDYYTVSPLQGATSAGDDEFVLYFTKSAPINTPVTFTISNLLVDLGLQAPAGHSVAMQATASNGTPFVGGVASRVVSVGSIPSATATVSQVATGAPSATGIALGTVTLTGVSSSAIKAGDELYLTLLDGAQFTTAGAIGGTLGAAGTPTITTVTNIGDTLATVVPRTSIAGETLTLSNAKVTMPPINGEVYLTFTDITTSSYLGEVGVASSVTEARVGGSDRYATASQLYESRFGSSASAVLTSGTNYPDALSAGYLARQLGTGVLTTDPGSLTTATKQELIAHSVTTVYIVGGTAAVSQNVANQVAALHVGNNPASQLISVVRVAGSDRYATSNQADIYKATTSTTAIVATGENFADALAVGPAVYESGDPLILTTGGSLSTSAKATIGDLGIKSAIIVGGTNAVSSAVESQLAAAGVTVSYRIAGADRTQTAADIAQWETDGLAASGSYAALPGLGFTGTNRIDVARGDNFADALAAGPVAGAGQNAIVLTSGPSTLGAGIPQYFAGRAGIVSTVQALGLTSAISVETLNAAAASLTEPFVL